MGYMIEITENKFEELAENAEKMLRYGGKVMSCLDSLKHGRMGERSPMPDYRDGWRDHGRDDDYDRYDDRRGGYGRNRY